MEPVSSEQLRIQYLNTDRSVNIQETLKQQKQLQEGGLEGIEIRQGAKNLGKDDFLKLLITQLSHQDPTQPVSDQQFIAQMAQFSSLEQMQNIASGLAKMGERQAYGIVGKFVIGKDFTTGEPVSGVAKALFYDNSGQVFLKVGGRAIHLNDVTLVGDPSDFRREAGGTGELTQESHSRQESLSKPAGSTNPQGLQNDASPSNAKMEKEKDAVERDVKKQEGQEKDLHREENHQVPVEKTDSRKEPQVDRIHPRMRQELERNYGYTAVISGRSFAG
jgi:flagellar basal-body rod modification protein FlgD